MSWKKTPVEERLAAAKSCTEGKLSQAEAARRLGVDESTVREWVFRYKEKGMLQLETPAILELVSSKLIRPA